MIRADIATAALEERVEERVRIAALLLIARKIRAQTRPWDGTRCDLLVADAGDAYGRKAIEGARKRGIPALLFDAAELDLGHNAATAHESDSTETLSQRIHALLGPRTADIANGPIDTPSSHSTASDSGVSHPRIADSKGADTRAEDSRATDSTARDPRAADSRTADSIAADSRALDSRTADATLSSATPLSAFAHSGTTDSALCRLATPAYESLDIDACRDDIVIRLRPSEGRVYAADADALRNACARFVDADWALASASPESRAAHGEASRSIEVFFLQAAFLGRDRLPTFPDGRYRMREWPDLGAAPELIGALKVARALIRSPCDAEQLRAACEMDARDVNASLWAYAASRLLEVSSLAPDGETRAHIVGAFPELLGRIARKFGLGRK